MRVLVFGAALLLVAGCEPEFGPDTYFCGPERFCPPELACDDSTFTCVRDFAAEPFSCPDESNMREPDDSASEAAVPGEVTCGAPLMSEAIGCIEGDDVDYVKFENDVTCSGADPHFVIKLRFPIATAPLTLAVTSEEGTVLAEGQDCTPEPNFSGRRHLCIEIDPEEGTTYFVRVQIDADGPDCGGDCRHNQYLLDISYPLS